MKTSSSENITSKSRKLKNNTFYEERSPLLDQGQPSNLNLSIRSINDTIAVINPQSSVSSFIAGRYPFTNCSTAVFLTVNACIGAGLLNVPQVFDESGGLVISFIIQSILLVFITGSLFILSYCVDISGVENYQDVVRTFCGEFWARICSYFIVLHAYGICIMFFVIIGDQSDRLLASLYGSDFCHTWYMNRHFCIPAISIALVLPLCFSKHIEFLKWPSSAGLAVIGYLLFLIAYEYSNTKVDTQIKLFPDHWKDVLMVVPVICFAYQCHLSWVPTYARMVETSSSTKLFSTIIGSILLCSISYTWTIIFGILTFGSGKLDTDLMTNYDPREKVVLVGIVALIFKTVTTYPLLLFCARIAIDKWYKDFTGGLVREYKRRAIIVLIWFASTLTISTALPDIGLIIDLVGTLAVTFIFFFPGLCLKETLKVAKDPRKPIRNAFVYITGVIYVALGCVIFLLSLAQWINNDFIKQRAHSTPLCSP